MKVLMVSTDRTIFDENSEARQRMVEYGALAEELHIIVFTKRLFGHSVSKLEISGNVFVYPTNSRSRWFYVFDTVKIGKTIIKNLNLKIENPENKILVSCQDPFECGLSGYRIAKRFKLPLQLQIHTDFMSPYFKKESLLNRIRVLIAEFLIPRADCARVVSKRIADSLDGFAKAPSENRLSCSRPHLRFSRGIFAPPISVLPIFVDIEKIKNAPIKTDLREKYPQFDFIILMASRLTKEKNIGLAIEAMGDVVKEYPKAGLVIVGNGTEKKNLKSQILNLKLENNVKIEDWTDDLISYYKTANLFLLTSNYEGYGRTLTEAVASGCNIISSDVGISGEILPQENIFEINNKGQLKERIIKAIKGELKMLDTKYLTQMPTKEEYLQAYKKTWEECL